MIHYIIIDDEHLAHKVIQGYCDLLPNLCLKKNCYDAFEALDYLSQHKIDLIFLDLNMPKLSGFAFLKTLTNPPKVIVTTAYAEHALVGYELNVVDYLLKPFSFERFLLAINKLISTTGKSRSPQINSSKETSKPSRIFIKGDKKFIQIVIDDILYLEAAGNYTKIITKQETFTTRDKISNLLKTLLPSDFIRVHKSYAVPINHIKSIEGNHIKIAERIIPIGKIYRMNVDGLVR